MKKIAKLLLGIVFVAIVSVSCNKDDDNASATIEGKWEYSKEGTIINGVEQLTDYENATGCAKNYLELLSNGNLNDIYFQSGNCSMSNDDGTWSKNGNTLIINHGDVPNTYTISELTSTTLKINDVFEDVTFVTVFKKI